MSIPLAGYLFRRLHQLHCHSIHGVPGDFMLRALDHLPGSGVRWIGNANELCAAYAADGYARAAALARRTSAYTDGRSHAPRVGALFTTYGVGELSAINGVAGSFAESVPVVHVVGTPSRQQWRSRARLHHTLGDGRLGIYTELAERLTCAQADLNCEDAGEAAGRIDRVLAECVKQSKPVYVSMPSDMVSLPVPSSLLATGLALESVENDMELEEDVVSSIVSRINAAERPLIIADGLSYPWGFTAEVNQLVQRGGIPTACFIAGKGVVDESAPSWIGALAGPTDYTSSTDLALIFGPLLSDTNTAGWSAIPDPAVTIAFGLDKIEMDGVVHTLRVKPLLKRLVDRIAAHRKVGSANKAQPHIPNITRLDSAKIEQDGLWERMSAWLKPFDTVLLANGTPLIGGRDMRMPSPVHIIASGIWTSIGSMLPATQGVAAAKRDLAIPGRTILFEGDGSFQVTCQAISDIIRYRLDATIFIANNAG